jgi:putative hydrolase of the HAD superfamily
VADGVTGGPFEAVVFDLFGTLVPEYTKADFYAAVASAAEVLGADAEAFRAEWDRTAVARQTGGFRDLRSNLREICDTLGLNPDDARIDRALEARETMYRAGFHPRAGAMKTLAELRARGYPIALVSMCAPDIPDRWRALTLSPFVDVTVFSSETGLRKPDPAIYLAATDALRVAPGSCVYCGDGAYGELTGAAAVGMTPFLIRDPSLDHAILLTPQRDAWDGPVIGDLRELLALLPARVGSGVGSRPKIEPLGHSSQGDRSRPNLQRPLPPSRLA